MPADIEIAAFVKADSVRFERAPESSVHFHGESESRSERENLPDEIEPGVTYRDVRVRWRASARLVGDGFRGPSGEGGSLPG